MTILLLKYSSTIQEINPLMVEELRLEPYILRGKLLQLTVVLMSFIFFNLAPFQTECDALENEFTLPGKLFFDTLTLLRKHTYIL